MLSVALTGNVAAGKSTVAEVWRSAGVPVVSADDLARRVVEPGTPGLEDVRATFGDEVVRPDGTLDRASLRERVFADDEARGRLEAILHPRIRALQAAWLDERRREGVRVAVTEIPLLFETAREGDFDVTVLVDAPEGVRLARLLESRGLSEPEARLMMAAQMDPEEKRRRADLVIENAGSVTELEARALETLEALNEREGSYAVLRMDLHLHTAGSWDCLSDPGRVLERARAVGLGRIAITDHNRLDVSLEVAAAHPEVVIPGEEVRTGEGIDVIGLYIHEEIPKGTPARETVERIRAQGGIPYLPHPYAGGKGGGGRYAEELAPLMDVVEVFNARLHPGRLNAPASDLAARHARLRGAGSDAHTLGELGGAWVEVPPHPNEPEAFLRAMATARVQGRTASNLVHLASTWAKLRKRLPGGSFRRRR